MPRLRNLIDRQLVERIAQGDWEALVELFKRYRERILYFLYGMISNLGNLQDAEDLCSNVMIAVWEGAGNFEGRSQVVWWIMRIAYFKALKWIEEEKEKERAEHEKVLWHSPPIGDPEQTVKEMECIEEIRKALFERLSPEQRAVVILWALGFKQKEIAEILKCEVGTVKSRLSRATKGELKPIAAKIAAEYGQETIKSAFETHGLVNKDVLKRESQTLSRLGQSPPSRYQSLINSIVKRGGRRG